MCFRPDTVVVRPNFYETGRANILLHCPSAPSAINVDLVNTGLVDGQAFTIKNAFNYFGTVVYTGVYNAASTVISLPLNTAAATAVATPLGMPTTPATTMPEFGAFIVVPGAAGTGVPGQPTGLTLSRISNTQINTAWTLGSGTPTSVTVEYSTDQISWTPVTLAANAVASNRTGLATGTRYYFRVRASNASGDSLYSDTVTKVLTGLHVYGTAPAIAGS